MNLGIMIQGLFLNKMLNNEIEKVYKTLWVDDRKNTTNMVQLFQKKRLFWDLRSTFR